jgi:glycosyltransferase involved in cell wall biosynthesis
MSVTHYSTLDTRQSPPDTYRSQPSAKVRLLELRNTYKWGGGPDKTILLSAERHNRSRVEVVVAYIRDIRDRDFRIGDKARAKGLTFYEIEECGKLDLRVLRYLKEIVLRHNINLIHSHDYKSDLFAFILRHELKERCLPVISTLHGWALLGIRGYVYWLLDIFLLRRFNHVIAVSDAGKEEMVRSGIRPGLISVIRNGIDTEAWSRRQVCRSARDALGLGNAFPVIGYVGRLSPEKDLETWLRSAALVVHRFPNARFIIVGEGRDNILLKGLKQLSRNLGIADKVHFLGYREDLPAIYATLDMFFLSSITEGICNSLLEAMAMEVPIVATDAGGTKELMVKGETGYVVRPGDIEAMAEALINLSSDKKLSDQMGRAGRTHVENRFSFTARLHQIEGLYERVLEETGNRHGRFSALPVN